MKVQDIMTTQLKVASPRTTLSEAAQLLWSGDCGLLPVVDNGKLVGVVTDRDMYIALGTRNKPASAVTVGEVVGGSVFTCSANDDAHTVLQTMKENRVRRLPVMRDGALAGIVSLNDLVLAAGPRTGIGSEELVETFKAICAHRRGPSAQAA
jgi:CBS domain-containing protein